MGHFGYAFVDLGPVLAYWNMHYLFTIKDIFSTTITEEKLFRLVFSYPLCINTHLICKVHPRLSTRMFRSKCPILWSQGSPEVHFAKKIKLTFWRTNFHYFWNKTSWYYLKLLAGNRFLAFTFLGVYWRG